ncbi:hypothetical protein B0H16DRAFT_1455962 [Mycena metata]|uniref:HNH nuclease domain-containing protein n=1 Tax=Mycena metata TaxID=1033252 RepID=A0AAD7NIE5_9AGAR|nr:hypothetical protein B0H16DRAFT_1455962 [Mycena metata]
MPIEDSESDPPSRASLDTVRDQVMNEKGLRPPHAARAGICTLTGVYDTYSTQLFPAINARSRDTNAFLGVAQCAHIFPETAEDGDKNRYEKLMGPDVHEYYNIMTMRVGLRHLFDQLDFWFEEVVEEKNTYDIISHNDVVFRQFAAPPRRVTFRVDPTLVAACNAAGSETPKLPSPALLALRAVCSLIAHMSGAGAHGDQILHDPEETPVIEEDGGSAISSTAGSGSRRVPRSRVREHVVMNISFLVFGLNRVIICILKGTKDNNHRTIIATRQHR